MEKYFLVRGVSGFVRVWGHDIIDVFQGDANYEILGQDLSEEEAVALARIANIEVKHRLGE